MGVEENADIARKDMNYTFNYEYQILQVVSYKGEVLL